jgi:hypothetical protein
MATLMTGKKIFYGYGNGANRAASRCFYGFS